MCAFWREEKSWGPMWQVYLCIKTAWIRRRKRGRNPHNFVFWWGFIFQKKLIFLPCPLFSTKACLSHNGRKILFSTTPARKPFLFFVCLYVCACVSILCFLISFRILLERTKKKAHILPRPCATSCSLIFPVFKAHTPTTIMYCAAVRSLFPDWCHFCAPYILILLPPRYPSEKETR